MKRVLLLSVQSRRAFSCRQLICVLTVSSQFGQPDWFGNGKLARYACAAGLRRFVGIRLPGNPAPVSGSLTVVAPVQPVPALKSPARSAWVGTLDVRTLPRVSRFHSCETKKCS